MQWKWRLHLVCNLLSGIFQDDFSSRSLSCTPNVSRILSAASCYNLLQLVKRIFTDCCCNCIESALMNATMHLDGLCWDFFLLSQIPPVYGMILLEQIQLFRPPVPWHDSLYAIASHHDEQFCLFKCTLKQHWKASSPVLRQQYIFSKLRQDETAVDQYWSSWKITTDLCVHRIAVILTLCQTTWMHEKRNFSTSTSVANFISSHHISTRTSQSLG